MSLKGKINSLSDEERISLISDYDRHESNKDFSASHPPHNESPLNTSIIEVLQDGKVVHAEHVHKTYYEVFFVTLPMFSGYAILFTLRQNVQQLLGISENSPEAYWFGVAASLVYQGNLVFRLGHNIFFAFLSPRNRVLLSMTSMFVSIVLIGLMFMTLKHNTPLWLVFVAYGFGGLGIGTFESNVLASITPVGKHNKFWAILGIPVGVNLITIPGVYLIIKGILDAKWICLGTIIGLGLGILAFLYRLYGHARSAHPLDFFQFFAQLKQVKNWGPQIVWHCIALMIDMFFLALLSPGGIVRKIYNTSVMPRAEFGWFHFDLSIEIFLVIFSVGFFLGDFVSRKVFYNMRPIFPLLFVTFCFVSAGFMISNKSELVILSGFFAAWANGSLYSQASRRIDVEIDKKYNLISLSFWLFIGDIGSVVGSLTLQSIYDKYASLHS